MDFSTLTVGQFSGMTLDQFSVLQISSPGSSVSYFVDASDVGGNMADSAHLVQVVAGSTIELMARISRGDGDPFASDNVASISIQVTDNGEPPCERPWRCGEPLDAPQAPYDQPEVSSVVYDDLRTDAWGADSVGYNVLYRISLPDPGTVYEVRITLSMASGGKVVLLYRIDAK